MPAVVDQERILAGIVERLVSALAPRRIILFGSRASGTARPDSDFDLLIVWRDENAPAFRSAAVRKALLGLAVPFDIAMVTPSEFERFRHRRVHVVGIASREGRVLHAA